MVWHGWYGGQDTYPQDRNILPYLVGASLKYLWIRQVKNQFVIPGFGSAVDWSIGLEIQG